MRRQSGDRGFRNREFSKLLRAVRMLPWRFGRPASDQTLTAMAKQLGCSLPDAVAALYADHDGVIGRSRPWRLMSAKEVMAFHEFVVELGWAGPGIRVFWTDDNSNYAGVYVEGSLAGHVAFIDHDEVDLSPVYSSVEAFLKVIVSAAEKDLDWPEMQREEPPRTRVRANATSPSGIDDLRTKLATARNGDERARLAMSIMKLTPLDETDAILAFLDDEDMYVQERACEVLGERKYEPAIEKLTWVMRHGMHNGRIAALRALGQIGTKPCLDALKGVVSDMADYAPYLAGALRGCGCETEHTGGGEWRYRLPGGTRWIGIRRRESD